MWRARARSDADVLGSSAELSSRQSGDACELSERQKWSRLTTRSKARFYNEAFLACEPPVIQIVSRPRTYCLTPSAAPGCSRRRRRLGHLRPAFDAPCLRQTAAAGVAAPKTIWLMHEMKGRSERWSECCCAVHNQPTDRVRSEEPSSFNPSLTLSPL